MSVWDWIVLLAGEVCCPSGMEQNFQQVIIKHLCFFPLAPTQQCQGIETASLKVPQAVYGHLCSVETVSTRVTSAY